MKKLNIHLTFLTLVTFISLNASAKTVGQMMKMEQVDYNCQLRVIESRPNNIVPVADYFFFIGYGDRADNHAPLFNKLSQAGIRVISFDYPSHGLSNCGSLNEDNYSSLLQYVSEIEERTREDLNRPVILSGWSTGGLLALRAAQKNTLSHRTIKSLILIAPGISVYPLVGGDGIIRESTLLSNPNPPHFGPPKPISPLLTPIFSTALIANGFFAREDGIGNIPTLMLVAGDKEDQYAKTPVLKNFILNERMKGSYVSSIQCLKSKHEMDNEREPIGNLVRENILNFAQVPSGKNLITNQECKKI